jgi:2-hydroxy-3-keto-5-methylthiopentenyl-1-phosphate phosphatase
MRKVTMLDKARFQKNSSEPAILPISVFSDFDGTIAHPDSINFLAEWFGGTEFRREIGKKILSGEISLRDGILQEVAVIKGTFPEVLELLRQHIEVDKEFPGFADWCYRHQVPLSVLSGGIQEVVENLLAPFNLQGVRIVANSLQITGGQWSLQFLDQTEWGHDKSRDVLLAKSQGYCTVFLGDGLSDRGAARSADIVFARAGLARYCEHEEIPYKEFSNFLEVQHDLMALLEGHEGTRKSQG